MTILAEIAARRARDVAAEKEKLPQEKLESLLASGRFSDRRDFRAALTGSRDFALIGEIKRASPSRGLIRAGFDPAGLAERYGRADVQALSVLTEPHFFGGCDGHPALARRACALPILRKDFLVDRWQVLESATLGVDAVLLIAALLPEPALREFIALARGLSLDALVEVRGLRELDAALAASAEIVGVNNRNLEDFTVSLSVTEALAPHVPSDRVLVAESGIRTAGDAARMRAAGARALLVGEAFMREDDIPAAVSRLRRALP